jgi:pimeloyl-ACP methyl ester carboxylesterase
LVSVTRLRGRPRRSGDDWSPISRTVVGKVGRAQSGAHLCPSADLEDRFALLAEIKQPMLNLIGFNHVMIAAIVSWCLAQNIPNAELIINPDAGHSAQVQYSERFLEDAIQFHSE